MFLIHNLNDQPIVFKNFVLGFLDLLNQRKQLREIKRLPNNLQDPVFCTLQQTVGNVMRLRKDIENFYQSFRYYKDEREHIESLRTSFEKLVSQTRIPLHCDYFSDSVIVYAPITNEQNQYKEDMAQYDDGLLSDAGPIQVYGILSLFYACSIAIAMNLARGSVLRGGIDVGIGMEIDKDNIYGPVLERAVSLEHDIAQYPRIVIGSELVDLLQATAECVESIDDDMIKLNSMYAKAALKLICQDLDGNLILDYLGIGIKELVHDNPSLYQDFCERLIPNVIKTFNSQVERIRCYSNSEEKVKLMCRYITFEKYLKSRIPLWIENGNKSSSI